MKIKSVNCIFFLILFFVPTFVLADGTIRGYVSDNFGVNIAGVTVTGPGGSGVTDTEGLFSFTHPAGTFSITASITGYASKTINDIAVVDSETTYQDFTLSPMYIETSYPSLGLLGPGLDIEIRGAGFDSNTRLALMPDSGNRLDVVEQFTTEDLFAAVSLIMVGDIAYVVDRAGGPLPNELGMLYILDVKEPTMPALLGSLSLDKPGDVDNNEYGSDIAVNGSFAYVTFGKTENNTGGLLVIDVSDPSNPQHRGSITSLDVAYGVAVVGSTAYVVDGICGSTGNLHAINVSSPDAPTVTWSLDTPFSYCALGLDILDNLAYVADEWGGLYVIDIDSASGSFKQTLNVPDEYFADLRGVQVVDTVEGTLAFVAAEEKGLLVYDVDISQPLKADVTTLIGSTDTPGFARNVDIADNVAYVADYVSGISAFDVSDLSGTGGPLYLGTIDSQGAALDIVVKGNLAYVANDHAGFGIINVNFLEKPTLVGYYRGVTGASDVLLEGDTLYLASEDGISVIDVTDPSTPSLNQQIALNEGTAQRIAKLGNKVYVAAYSGDLQIVDLTIPSVTTVNIDNNDPDPGNYLYNYNWSVAVDSSYIYVADGDCDSGATGGLTRIDQASPGNSLLHRRIDLGGCATDVVVIGNYAYVTVYDDDDGTDNGLKIIDVSGDPLIEVKTVNTPAGPNGLSVISDHAYVADSWEGLQIINVAIPATASIVGSTGTLGHEAWDVEIVGTAAYIADFDSGVYVVDVIDVTDPVVIGSVDTPGFAQNLAIDGDVAHVADSFSGLTIVPLPLEITSTIIEVQEGLIKAILPSPLIEGHYILRVFNKLADVEDTLEGAVTFSSTIELLTSKAIIVAGGGPLSGPDIWEDTKAYVNYAYDNLILQGYRHEDIYYLTDEPAPLARWGALAATYANVDTATNAHLDYAIRNWAMNDPDISDLLIYFADHGDTESFVMRGGPAPEQLSADDLDDWLDELQATIPGKVILVFDACRSGSFIPRVVPPQVIPPADEKVRITLTSSTPGQASYFLSEKHSFSSHFWSSFSGKSGNKAIPSEAFKRAAETMASYQNAQLDVNGNGVPNEPEDFTDFEAYEGTMHAMRRQFYYKDRSKPEIMTIPADQSLFGETSATLSVENIVDDDGDVIKRVWAEIVAPDYNPDPSALTVTSLPTVELEDLDVDGVYDGVYDQFTYEGSYIVTYYAEDTDGIVSYPRTSLVKQFSGSSPAIPDQYEIDDTYDQANVIVLNNPAPQIHTFHQTGDADWVKFYGINGFTYRIKAANPTIITDPEIAIYSSSNLVTPLVSSNTAGLGTTEFLNWNCPSSGMYYVRLANRTTSSGANVRYQLSVWDPTVFSLPGYVTGSVTSGGEGVGGAVLVASGGSAVSQSNGSYLMSLEAGSHGVSVSKSGYQSAFFSVSVVSGGSTHKNVALTSYNTPPTIGGTPPDTVHTNVLYFFAPTVSDPDGDTLSFTATEVCLSGPV